MKLVLKSIIVILVFAVPVINSLLIYGQESTNSIREQIQTTPEKIKNMASEVVNNSTV